MPWARYQWQGPHLRASAMQLRLFLQLLRFLANGLRTALVCLGMPETRHPSLSDPQLRSRSGDVELPAWAPGEDLCDFVNWLTSSLPLREPSPVDLPRLRALPAER